MEGVKCQRMLEYCDTKAFLPVHSHVDFLALLLGLAMAQNRNAEAQVMSRFGSVFGNRFTDRLCFSYVSHQMKMREPI